MLGAASGEPGLVYCQGFSSFTPRRLNRPHRCHSISWGLAVDKVILAQDITLSKLEDNKLQELDRGRGRLWRLNDGVERVEVLQRKEKASFQNYSCAGLWNKLIPWQQDVSFSDRPYFLGIGCTES